MFLYLSYFPDQMDCILLKSKHVIEVRVYVKHNKRLLHFNFLLMKVKEESEKIGLKLSIHKMKIMASEPITSWEIDGETVATVSDFILGGSKITADGDCSHEIKTLTPWKESYDQPRHHIQKQRHYFANKGPSSQGYGFSSSHVWM